MALAGGMTGLVTAANFVDISSSGISLTGVSGPPSSTFSLGGLSITTSNLQFGYNILTNDLSFSATAQISVNGLGTGTFDIAGDLVGGKLADLTLTLAPTSSIAIVGVTLTQPRPTLSTSPIPQPMASTP